VAPLLVLPPRYTDDSNALWRAAIAANWDIARLTDWRVPLELRERDLSDGIAVYGEPLFVAVVAEALHLKPIEPPLDFLPQLPFELRGREVQLSTLAEARGITKAAFIKPAGEKTFAAQVYESGAALPVLDWLEAATPVLISEPVRWQVEIRCFVGDGQVQTLSPYWRDDKTAQEADGSWPMSDEERQGVQDFAVRVLSETTLQVGVLDVGIIAEFGWAVVEVNPAFGSGIYGCDPTKVLQVVRRAFDS
jgi:hypothetical protein